MVPEIFSSSFTTVLIPVYQRYFAIVLDPKLRSTYDVVFMRAWFLKVGILDISSKEFKSVWCCIHECNAQTLPGYDSSICGSNRVESFVSVEDPSSLPSEVHIYIPDKVAS